MPGRWALERRGAHLPARHDLPAAGGPDAGKPFLLYVAFAHTHTPLAYEAKYENASTRPGYHQVFANTLAEVDGSVGEIVAALESNGLAEDTLIVLTAGALRLLLGRVLCTSC